MRFRRIFGTGLRSRNLLLFLFQKNAVCFDILFMEITTFKLIYNTD